MTLRHIPTPLPGGHLHRALERVEVAQGGRAFVRAGLHPDMADEDNLLAYVRDLARGWNHATMFLPPTARAYVASEALRGWVTHQSPTHSGKDLPAVWHRLIGGTAIEVGVAGHE